MSQGHIGSLHDFIRLVARFRRGDEVAAERLWCIIQRWIRASAELLELRNRYPDLLDDATSHVLVQLWSGKWRPAQSRRLAAVQRWVRVTARRRTLDELAALRLPRVANDILDAQAAPENTADESLSRQRLQRISHALREIDTVVSHHLRRERAKLNWFAVYLLEGRIGLYNLFTSCDGDAAQTGFACFHLVQALLPWSAEDGALRFRPCWPTIGDIWAALGGTAGPEALSITSARLIEAVKALAPSIRTTAQVHYKWRQRLREELIELLDSGALGGLPSEAVTFWRAIYGI